MTTTTITDADRTPRVWIGCLACYNEGRLVGDWRDAADADEVTTADVHGRASSHDELWCFDTENMPVPGEMGPSEAAEGARRVSSVASELQPALYAWIAEKGDVSAQGDNIPSIDDFEEQYAGEWASFREFAEQMADDIGLLSCVPEQVVRYFDWEAWIRDLRFDYTTAPSACGVFVFRSY